jgi:hypothetical protein
MKFYSKEELTALKSAIRNGENLPAAAKRLSKELNRTQGSVYLKILSVAKEIGAIKHKTKKAAKVIVTKQPEQGITLKNGFVFDFKPQRAEMYQDHVRIYF